MKKIALSIIIYSFITVLYAQQPVGYKLYGFIRNDFFYNTRVNTESVDGLYYLYPQPVLNDNEGNDINAQPNSEMLSVASRVGLDIFGDSIFKAKVTAKVEADFAGTTPNFFLFRIRQAYTQLNWEKTELLIGQTWHPLFGSVSPTVLDLNTGAPFQPFNRSPQAKLSYNLGTLKLSLSALYQLQYVTFGPIGRSNTYLKNANVPNLFFGIENNTSSWKYGAGIDCKKITPRTTSLVGTDTYKVDESLSSVSGTVYLQYLKKMFTIKGKATYGQNLSDLTMLSGYGVSSIGDKGKREYTSFQNVSVWSNIVYGQKIKFGVFGGYSKNLGTTKPLYQDLATNEMFLYGYSFNGNQMLDEMFRLSSFLSYNKSNWMLAMEYAYTQAYYGDVKPLDGKVALSVPVSNNRILGVITYYF
jgi:hypothetical protein